MKRYTVLQCNTCKRIQDSPVNSTHYTPDRCTITLGCEGRLVPIGSASNGSTVQSVPPDGLSNWFPRGSSITPQVALQADALYDTKTGVNQQIILAVSDADIGFTPGHDAVITLELISEQQTPRDFRQYTYRRSSQFTVINGVEDGAAKKVLRYDTTSTPPDVVEVFLNGVKQELGTASKDYVVFDGTSGIPNSIQFNSQITGSSNQIDVVVSKASAKSTVSLQFKRLADDESRDVLGAWEGVDAVRSPAIGRWSLFYNDFIFDGGTIAVDVRLRLNGATQKIVNVPGGPPNTFTQAALLLSRSKLYTQLDRLRAQWVPISELMSNTEFLVAKRVGGVLSLFVTETAVKNLFPVLEVLRFDAPSRELLQLGGNAEATDLNSSIIIGPDA